MSSIDTQILVRLLIRKGLITQEELNQMSMVVHKEMWVIAHSVPNPKEVDPLSTKLIDLITREE